MHGGVSGDRGFPVGRRDGLVAGLRSFERAVFDRESRDDPVPGLGGHGAFEVIRKKELLFFAIGPAGIGARSAAKAAVVMRNERAIMGRRFMDSGEVWRQVANARFQFGQRRRWGAGITPGAHYADSTPSAQAPAEGKWAGDPTAPSLTTFLQEIAHAEAERRRKYRGDHAANPDSGDEITLTRPWLQTSRSSVVARFPRATCLTGIEVLKPELFV